MSKQTEALKLALEALKELRMLGMNAQWHDSWLAKPNEAIAAIREALAEQETVLPGGGHVPAVPVAVYGYCPECGGAGVMRERRPNGDDKCTNGHKYPSSKALAEQPAQQQEPVAYSYTSRITGAQGFSHHPMPRFIDSESWDIHPLYTSPPASKPWVGLTDEEWQEIDSSLNGKRDLARIFVRTIEAKLREKNA